MSAHEVKLFEANFNVWKTERAAGLTESKAFERYVIEQVLKDFNLPMMQLNQVIVVQKTTAA